MGEAPQTGQAAGALSFRQGMAVEVMTLENSLIFVGRVESFQNGALVIRESKGDELPSVVYNREIKLRFFNGQGTVVIHGKICGSTSLIWKLDRLEGKFTKEQRAFFRQRISPNCRAMCLKRAGTGGKAKRAVSCQVLDISAGGILISSEELYYVGDRLSITDVRLVEREDPFSFNCQVRRAGEADAGVIRYGCQFEILPAKEQDRLLRAIFAVQREEIRNRKERDAL